MEGKRIWGKLIKSVPFKDKNSCCNCIDFYFELFLLRKKKKCAKCKKDKLRMISSIPWIFNRTFIFEWRPDEIQINVINRRPFPISLISRLASWPIYINWISLRIVLDYRYIYIYTVSSPNHFSKHLPKSKTMRLIGTTRCCCIISIQNVTNHRWHLYSRNNKEFHLRIFFQRILFNSF